jgi:hypothetical protein
MKVKMMTKHWSDEGLNFNKVTPTAGLFQHKETNEIVDETKQKSWNEKEILQEFPERDRNIDSARNQIHAREWEKLFFSITTWYSQLKIELIEASAEVANVNARAGPHRERRTSSR